MGGLVVMNYLPRQETWVRCLGQENALEVGNSLQYSYQENPMDRGAWWAMVHGVTKSQTWLNRLNMRTCNQIIVPSIWTSPNAVVQSLSHVSLFATPWTAAHQASLSITNSRSLPKLMSIKSVMPFNHLILCWTLLLPSIFPSIRVFSNESVLCIMWPKYWSFSFSISPSKDYSGLISFRIDWFDLLEVKGTLKSLLQHHSLKAWILRRSTFFKVQLSHPYMTIGETIALTIWTVVGKVISVLFNMLSRFDVAFLPRSKHLLISWLLSPSSVILEPKK